MYLYSRSFEKLYTQCNNWVAKHEFLSQKAIDKKETMHPDDFWREHYLSSRKVRERSYQPLIGIEQKGKGSEINTSKWKGIIIIHLAYRLFSWVINKPKICLFLITKKSKGHCTSREEERGWKFTVFLTFSITVPRTLWSLPDDGHH